jgi:hypothetical protein
MIWTVVYKQVAQSTDCRDPAVSHRWLALCRFFPQLGRELRARPGKGDAFALTFLLFHWTLITFYSYNIPVNNAFLGNPCYEVLANCIVGNGRERLSGWE